MQVRAVGSSSDATHPGGEATVSSDPTRPRIPTVRYDRADAPLNIFATLAHNRPLSKAFRHLGAHLLSAGVLPARVREIVILRVGWRCGSEYEFGQHTVIGRSVDLTDDEIARLAEGPGEWSEDDRALVAMVDELCADDVVSEGTWQALSRRWSEAELLELLVLAGFYRMVSGMLNSAGVALEPSTPGWPDSASPVRRAPRQGAP
jgi:alkylhydroperoxidase family enzyme